MLLSVKYAEVQGYVKEHFSKDLEIAYVSDKTVKLTLRVKVLISVPVSVNLSVKDVNADSILLGYEGKGIDLIITGALKFLEGKLGEYDDILVYNGDNSIAIRYAKIKDADKVLEHLSLNDLSFNCDSIIASATLR